MVETGGGRFLVVSPYHFDIDPYVKERLLKNMDELDYLVEQLPEIVNFDMAHKPEIFAEMENL